MKNYNNFLDDDKNWQIIVNDDIDSWFNFKSEAVDRVVDIIITEGDIQLKKFKYEGDLLTIKELKKLLEELPEEDFYTLLDEIKKESSFNFDIKMFNISDDKEIDFLKDEDYNDFLDFD